ncbi:MAG: T9SS type A sorting domain-containing protein, partial [Bacteroidetes bacterium]
LAGNSAPYTFSWSSSETTEDISGLTPGDYSVTITNADGCDTTITFTVLNTAGLDDITDIQYQITPNPNNGQFTLTAVNFTGDQLVVKVFDATGRIVYDSPLKYIQGESIDMNLQFLEAGTYMLSLEGSGRISQKRIVIY